MKLKQIKEAARAKGVYDKINWKSTKFVYIKVPKKLLEALELYEFVFFGTGDMKDYHNSLYFISHAEDYLAQLVSVAIPVRKRRIQKVGGLSEK